jgi:2-C-methyl-D-erythritol 2,4-cyclodiphosphate synthase
MENKVGIGYDIHRLVEGRKLVLGGVEIPYIRGLFGYSDADVLLHAVCDALLGALGKGDIGEHFPNTDEAYRDISSVELLKKVTKLVEKYGFKIKNVDTVVIADEPHIGPFKNQMRSNIAGTLKIPDKDVNIKATTQEGVSFGKEAIAAYAVVQLQK